VFAVNDAVWNEVQEDVLREVGNIGAGHAATALSSLLQEEVRISVTCARICSFDEISEVVGGAETVIAAVFLRMTGDVQGNMLLLLTLHSARQLLRRLFQSDREIEDFSELELSALGEVGNILAGAYLNAIGRLTSLNVAQSVPAVAVDMAGAILDIGILMAGETSDAALLIDTRIAQGSSEVEGHFFLLPDPQSLPILLAALGCSHG
jgi:chemotaxis protein CheC